MPAGRVFDLQAASIADVQASISANDSKASAALIVHGLLFTGLIGLITHLGKIYDDASLAQRILALSLLGLALGAFVLSIYFILRALVPYRPSKGIMQELEGRYLEVFFPLDLLGARRPYDTLLGRLHGMDQQSITAELAAERLKLADILRHESVQTQRGYRLLLAEIVFVALFLVVLATAAL